ncbi:hypothetical protein ACVW0P_003683 [Mucilaginibacter sp. UYNi724]
MPKRYDLDDQFIINNTVDNSIVSSPYPITLPTC